jgi:hypothetical protein
MQPFAGHLPPAKVKAFKKSTNIKSWCSNFTTTASHIPQLSSADGCEVGTEHSWLHSLDYCPLHGTAAYTAMSNGWTYNILLSGSRQPTELENRLVSNICYSMLFGSTKKEIKTWIKILSIHSKKTTSQPVHFCLYHIMLCTVGHFVLTDIFS